MSEELQTVTLWIPAHLVNSLNAREHWQVTAERARRQREAVCAALLERLGHRYQLRVGPALPKRVTFHAYVARLFDSDGLQAAMKSLRDGLQDARLIDDDRPEAGHVFHYEQTVTPQKADRGVRITVGIRHEQETESRETETRYPDEGEGAPGRAP